MGKIKNWEDNFIRVHIQMSNYLFIQSAKFIIEKAVKQVFHVYPTFDTDILQFSIFHFTQNRGTSKKDSYK